MPDRRTLLSRLWIAVSVLYGLLRAGLVWRFLSGYGVNPFVFVVLEGTSSFAYGWASGRLVLAVIDGRWRDALAAFVPALMAYAAPDAYVLLAVGRLPDGVMTTLVAIVAVTASLTCAGIVLQVRRGRRARTQPAGQ